MDFNDTPADAEFRETVRTWLKANAGAHLAGRLDDAENMAKAKAWQALKADAGYSCISWPTEWGGRGGTPTQALIFAQEEEALFGADYSIFELGQGICMPALLTYADEATRQRFGRRALRGEDIWCQLFSEPSAGSDVAGGRTRAVRKESGDWVIDGQKVWTSGAHYSDYGLLLARTDPAVPKHKGLTVFWVDMKTPGIDIRPIHQASGGSEFNEVYFTGVRIPDSQRVGGIGQGWQVALTALMNERLSVGGGTGWNWGELLDLARGLPGPDGHGSALDAGGLRDSIADLYVKAEGLRFTRLRALAALGRGETPGPEASMGKLVSARQMQEVASEALERLDQYGLVVDANTLEAGGLLHSWFWGSAMRIAGGTDEILKNIIAERVLGLPSDVRVDRDAAFKDLPQGV